MASPERRRLAGAVACVALGLVRPGVSTAKGRKIPTISVDELRPGMKGYALTVFSGTRPERFPIQIIDVVRNYMPKQDAVLFTSPDPRLQHSGIVGGMSGSPIFIDGKLAGALAYGYRFNKDPIGGMTPIANMLDVARLPYRPEVLPTARMAGRGAARGKTAAWADTILGLDASPLPPRRRPTVGDSVGLATLPIPLAVSGLGARAAATLAGSLGMVPARGGKASAAAGPGSPRPFAPGDSVSVVLIDGESSVAPNGTITWVDPKAERLLAFGHPMFGDGPTNLPFADARVHTIIPSVERSVKLSSAGTIRGTMVQDRQAAISLRTGVTAPVIPVTTQVRGADPDLPPRTYQNRVGVALDLTPNLLAVLLSDAAEEGARDATEVVLRVEHEYDVVTRKGARTVRVVDEEFFPSGVIPRMLARTRGVVLAAAILDNPYEVGRIRAVRQRAELTYGAPLETIEQVRVPHHEIRAGDVLELSVTLRDYHGKLREQTVPVRIPRDVGGETIQLQVTGGDFTRPYRPIPDDLDDLLDTFESFYPGRALVVSVFQPAEGLSTRHGLLTDVPDSVLESLTSGATTRKSVRMKRLARRVLPTPTLIEGDHTLKIEVAKRRPL